MTRLMTIGRLGLLLTLFLPGVGVFPAVASTAGKAAAPIILSIVPDEPLEPGKIAEFTVTARVLVDASDFLLHIDLPDTLALFSGDREWRGPVSRGTQQRLRFSVRVPESGIHRITVSGSITTASGRVLATQEIYEIGTARNMGAKGGRPAGVPRGGGVKEYELP